MVFPFTFRLPLPIPNPFASVSNESTPAEIPSINKTQKRLMNQQAVRRRPSPLPTVQIPRKRGWEPTFAEPTGTTTTLASSSGYLDTPSKYRDLARAASSEREGFHDIEAMAMEEAERDAGE
jgi:hypothetical protein